MQPQVGIGAESLQKAQGLTPSFTAQCLYALSFDNKPFKRSLTGMSEAMEALRDVLALPDAGVPSPAEKDQKGKKKADGSRSVDGESYTDRVVGLKVLVAGEPLHLVPCDGC